MAYGDLNNGGFINPFTKEEDERKARLRGFMGESVEAPQSVTNGQLTGFLGQPLAQEEINPTVGMLGSVQPIASEVPTTPPATAMNTEVPVAPVAPTEAIPGLIGGSMPSQPNLSNVAEFNQAMNSFLGQGQGSLQPVPQEADLRGIGRDEVVSRAASINEQAKAFGASGGEAFRESQDFVNRAFLANQPTDPSTPIPTGVMSDQDAQVVTPQAPTLEQLQGSFTEFKESGQPITTQQIADAKLRAAELGAGFDPEIGYTTSIAPMDTGVARTQAELLRGFGAPTISQIQAGEKEPIFYTPGQEQIAQPTQTAQPARSAELQGLYEQLGIAEGSGEKSNIQTLIDDRERLENQQGAIVQGKISDFKSIGSGFETMRKSVQGLSDDAISTMIKSSGGDVNKALQVFSELTSEEATRYAKSMEAGAGVDMDAHAQILLPPTEEYPAGQIMHGGMVGSKLMYNDPDTGKLVQAPRGTIEYNSTQSETKRKRLDKLEESISESSSAIIQLEDYRNLRNEGPQGLEALRSRIFGIVKTVLNDQDLTEDEYNTLVGQGKFQGLLGKIRKEVLGPGVLTEQDARRLMQAIGGFGVTSNKKVVDDLLAGFIKKRKINHNKNLRLYRTVRKSDPTIFNEYLEKTNSFPMEINAVNSKEQLEQRQSELGIGSGDTYVYVTTDPNTGESIRQTLKAK